MHYKLTLPCHKIELFRYGKTDINTPSITTGTSDSLTTIDVVIDSLRDEKNHNDVKMIAKTIHKEKGMYLAAKIEKGYVHFISMMIKKYIKRGREVKGNIMVIDSSDGAVHFSTNTKGAGIVSYSSQLFHQDYFAHGISSVSSNNILMDKLIDRQKNGNSVPSHYTNT